MGNKKSSARLRSFKQGFVYYMAVVLLLFGVFCWYIAKSPVAGSMDFAAWFYFATAAVSQAALFALIPFVLSLPALTVGGGRRLFPTLLVALSLVTVVFFIANGLVYSLYRFHINGFILEMLFGGSAGDIFQFDAWLYVKVAVAVALLAALFATLWFVARRVFLRKQYVAALPCVLFILFCLLYSNLYHAYAAVAKKPAVIRSAAVLPYYVPLTANRFMQRMGVVSKEELSTNLGGGEGSGIKYPMNEIVAEPDSVKKNILLVLIDSWNKRSWSQECFPNLWEFTRGCSNFDNHISSSNGTYGSVFGLFFGLPSYFRKDIDVSGVQPVLVEQLLAEGYDVKAFASATLVYPPFARLMFSNVPNLRIESEGKTVYDRDCEITNEFIEYVDTVGQRPFFAFLFYDLAHGYEMPDEKKNTFTPSWKYADYLSLDNDADPLPFWNLYRNSLFQVDSLVGRVIDKLQERNMLHNTVVVLTGDHGQEFNENKKNYWGHGSNFSPVQVRVPFFCFDAEKAARVYRHRTTHYDLSATLLKEYLGVCNDVSDLGAGHLLTDSCRRDYHIVGDDINYAFILEDNMTILEKKFSGSMEVYDSLMNPLDDYRVDAAALNRAILDLNRFYR